MGKIIFAIALILLISHNSADCRESPRQSGANSNNAVHARPWTFGQSIERKANIWQKGMDGKSMLKKSVPQNKQNAKSDVVKADEHIFQRKAPLKSSMGLSVRDEKGSWKVAPLEKQMRVDEDKLRDNKHVVSAYADVEAAENLNISIGPELILKDDSKGDEHAKADQPDSALGVGMKFKYGF